LTASDNSLPPWISGEFDVNSILRGAPLILSRAQFLDDVERQLQITRKSIDSRFAVLLVNLDNYTAIVTEKGRTAADMLIRAILEPIGPLLARHESVAILGNGTIGILLETARLRVAPQDFAAEVVGEIKTVAAESGVMIPSASVGIAKVTGNYTAAEDILRDAGIALSAAQSAGSDQTMQFHRGMDEVVNQTPIAI
jgi:GGDEF domain-containing protein